MSLRHIERGTKLIIFEESQQRVVDVLKKMTHLQYLLLDNTFVNWEEELTDALPETVVFVDQQDPDIYAHDAVYSKIAEIHATMKTNKARCENK